MLALKNCFGIQNDWALLILKNNLDLFLCVESWEAHTTVYVFGGAAKMDVNFADENYCTP